jgi:hypothetical protein
MRSLSEDAPIKQTWLGTTNVGREFPVSSAHVCVQSVRKNIREDMEDRRVTNLSEDRKIFYLVSSLLDPHTKMLPFCDNKYFPSPVRVQEGQVFSQKREHPLLYPVLCEK